MIIPKDYFVALLNELSRDSGQVVVKYPPIGTIFTIKIDEMCTLYPMPKEEFKYLRKNLLDPWHHDKFISNEIPTDMDLTTCLYASSILRSEGESSLKDKLQEGCKRNLMKGDKPLFIGYDTNSLRHRSNRVVAEILSGLSRDPVMNIGFCLNEIIKEELRYRWDHKYRISDVNELSKVHRQAHNFLNQHPKDARMARMGAVEYKHIMTQPNCVETIGRGYGDIKIIRSFEFFRDKRNVDILLISGDNDFTAMAHEEKMNALYLKQPTSYDKELEASWEQVVELLYCVAVVFGHVLINGIDVYGIWKGKVEDDWDGYRISIDPYNRKLKGDMFRDIRILERGVHDTV